MLIYVCVKDASKLTKRVKVHPFYLEDTPNTPHALVRECVLTCVRDFRERANKAETLPALTDEQMDGMREVGKFTFGFVYGKKDVSEERAIETALQAVQDGIVRIFKGSEEITLDDGNIEIKEGDTLTFVKLAMLSGRLW